MKKTRLLEIIREEIVGALNELTLVSPSTPTSDINTIAKAEKVPATSVAAALDQAKKSGKPVNVAEMELEEEQLDEMAYNIVLSDPEELARLKDRIKDSTKKGEQLLLKVIDIIQRDKKENKPIRQRDIANELDTIQQKINPLVNVLIDYGILSKGESVTGVTKKAPSDKPKKEKPASTGKKERPAASNSASKKATLTPGDDGFDKVTYDAPTKASDEEKATAAAARADKSVSSSGKYAKNLTPEEEDLFKIYKRQAVTLVNQIEDAGSAAEKQNLSAQLKALRNNPEVAALFKAKGVTI